MQKYLICIVFLSWKRRLTGRKKTSRTTLSTSHQDNENKLIAAYVHL